MTFKTSLFLILCMGSAVFCFAEPDAPTVPSTTLPSIQWNSSYITIDGEPFLIRGINYNISYPKMLDGNVPFEVLVEDIRRIKKAGFNTIRTYWPLSPKLLDVIEQEGLMVIQSVSRVDHKTDFNSTTELERLKVDAAQIIQRDKNRKCILMWALWNDAPFPKNVVKTYGSKTVDNFFGELYRSAKKEDPTRPITASNILNAPGYEAGLGHMDVIGVNIYLGISWLTGEYSPKRAQKNFEDLLKIREKYQKPVYVAETGYSTFWKASSQEIVIPAQIRLVGKKLAGIILFEWQDEWQKFKDWNTHDDHVEEHWGLLDGFRNEKSAFPTITELFQPPKPKKSDIDWK